MKVGSTDSVRTVRFTVNHDGPIAESRHRITQATALPWFADRRPLRRTRDSNAARPGLPGGGVVRSGGDIDNRLKTLLDALRHRMCHRRNRVALTTVTCRVERVMSHAGQDLM